MKFIASFLLATALLSADTCYKLSLGNAAVTNNELCAPTNIFTPQTPVKCTTPTLQVQTTPTIQCDKLPVVAQCPPPVVTKVTTAPVVCPKVTTPVIECPKYPGTTVDPKCPTTATPEPASYALLGAGLMTAGLARQLRRKKQ